MYTPRPLGEGSSLVANVLAAEAHRGQLVIVAGAGLSMAAPTNLPSGGGVAEKVADLLANEVAIPDAERSDLVAIGDRLQNMPGGSTRLQQVLLDTAPFTNATPNFGHRVLALLVAEGAAPVMLFNWDDCVERAGEPQARIQSVVNDPDARSMTEPRDYKLHGCARRAGSLLVSSTQLAAPPTWATDSVRAQLATGAVLFVGVGDIPSYIERRIEQLKAEVGDVSGIWVAALGISAQWDVLVPELREDHKIESDADAFLDDFLRGYCRLVLTEVSNAADAAASSGGALHAAVAGCVVLRDALEKESATWLLELALDAALDWPAATPILASTQMRRGLVALGILAAATRVGLDDDERLTLGESRLELVIARDNVAPGAVASEAEHRVRERQQRGGAPFAEETLILSSGHMGELDAEFLLRDVSSSSDPDAGADLIEATTAGRVRFLDAGRITSGEVPDLAA